MMRIVIQTSPNTVLVPFDYLPLMVGTIHKWLGKKNNQHGRLSLYSFSWLMDGEIVQGQGRTFPNGARFFVSFYNNTIAERFINRIDESPKLFCGMAVTKVNLGKIPMVKMEEPDVFTTASPIHIRRNVHGNVKFFTFEDGEITGELMKRTLLHKMRKARLLEDPTLKISFVDDGKLKKRLVHYRGIANTCTIGKVLIEGKTATKRFAWAVGLGNSTGIGFGALF